MSPFHSTGRHYVDNMSDRYNSKSNSTFDAASISTSSIMSEKERAHASYGTIEAGSSKPKQSKMSKLVESKSSSISNTIERLTKPCRDQVH